MPVLLEGPGGLPLIPPPTLGVKGEETAENAAIIIRKYFTRHFSQFSWNPDILLFHD